MISPNLPEGEEYNRGFTDGARFTRRSQNTLLFFALCFVGLAITIWGLIR
jgi:hypothetical protein